MIADQLVLTPIEPREHPWTGNDSTDAERRQEGTS